jgi:hypothetical protein
VFIRALDSTKSVCRVDSIPLGHCRSREARHGCDRLVLAQPDSIVAVSFFPSFYGGKKPPRTAWPLREQPGLRTRPRQSGLLNPLLLNILITSSTSLFHRDNLTRHRVFQGGVAGMAQLKASRIKRVSPPPICVIAKALRPTHARPRLCQCTALVRDKATWRL